jgi:hypothetical protein
MSTARRPAKLKKVPVWARAAAAIVSALGSYCLVYHLVFWFLWRFLFGEEVWPWPRWSLWILVVLPSLASLAAAGFMLLARFEKRNIWIAVGIGGLSLFGLFRYAAEVWKVMFQLGFKPW